MNYVKFILSNICVLSLLTKRVNFILIFLISFCYQSISQTTIALTVTSDPTTVCQGTVVNMRATSNNVNAVWAKWVRVTGGNTATGTPTQTTSDGSGNFSYTFSFTASVLSSSQTTHVFRVVFGPTETDVDLASIPPAFETSNTLTITVNPRPAFQSISPSTPSICLGQTSFSPTLTYTQSPTQYKLDWTGQAVTDGFSNVAYAANNFPSSGTITVSVPNTATARTYSGTLRVRNANGCESDAGTASFEIKPTPTVAAITGANAVCVGSTITLANTTTGGTWSVNNSNASINTSGVLTGSSAGTTTVSYAVTGANSCVTTVTSSKTINALPTVAAITGANAVCVGSTITLANTTTGGTWSVNNSNASINTSGVLTGSSAGTTIVSYAVTNGNNCTTTVTSSKTINALPTVATITGSSAVCVGSTIALANTTSGGTWSVNNSNATISTSGILTGSAVGSTTVSYTVTNSDNCTTTVTAVRTINALPNVQPISGNAAVCVGSSITLGNATTGGTWSVNNSNATISTSGILTGSAAGTTTVSYSVTDANNCTASVTVVRTINALPIVAAISGANGVCVGANTLLTNATTGGVWSVNNSNASISNSGVLTGNTSGTTTVTYTFTNNNGCTASVTSSKTIFPQPVLQITNPAGICSPGTINLTQASITAGSTAGLQYTYWTNAAATLALSSPTLVGSAGTYYIRGTETVNNCSVIKPVTVSVLPQASMVINTPATVCSPNTVDITNASITSGSASGLTFTYFTDAIATQTLNTPNAISQSGTYYIKGTPAVGCSAVTPVTVTINPLPSLVVNSPAAVCAPGIINLTRPDITAGSSPDLRFNYFIDAAQTGEVGDATQITRSGTYYIRATNNQTGCRNNASVAVTVHPLPAGQLQTPAVNFICENGSLTLSANGATAYQWLRDQQPISGATNASYTATAGGTYTVRFISAQGCTRQATENITLEVLAKPVIDFAIEEACVGVQTNFHNRSATINSGGLNWLWEFGDGSTSNEISTRYAYLNPGVYRVKLTASNPNCAVTESKTVEYIVRSGARSVRYPDIETLPGVAVTVKARNNIGNIYTWTPNTGLTAPTASTTSVTVNETTLYKVSITSDIGCVTTDTVLVKVLPGVDILVPQGFSPNNDGQNDRLYPMLVGMRQLNYFKVFNRWGNNIFSTGSASASAGWDGMYLGQLQASGAYTWVAEAIDLQGRVVRKTGTVLLLR